MIPLYVQEILLVLDGTTGLNMLPQAREFNEVLSPIFGFRISIFGHLLLLWIKQIFFDIMVAGLLFITQYN